MKTLQTKLKREAREACWYKGHLMTRFKKKPYSTAEDAFCINCGMMVTVQAYPPANSIQIGSEAVAVGCSHLAG